MLEIKYGDEGEMILVGENQSIAKNHGAKREKINDYIFDNVHNFNTAIAVTI